ncbi:MAG: FtsW/RodA/SpoVE family cell cycle protein [Bacilli bacterium]
MKLVIRKFSRLISHMDKKLLITTIILFTFGLLNIVTASSRESINYDYPLYYYFYQQIKILFAGVIVSLIILNIDTKDYKKWAILAFLAIGGMLIYLSLTGDFKRGSQNWLVLPVIGSVQPSEFAKPVIIVCLALLFEAFYYKLRDKKINHYDMIAIILAVGLVFPLIIFFQKDFGTMFIILCIFGGMFLASPILRSEKFKTILLLLGLGICMLFIIVVVGKKDVLSLEQLDRFNFFNPCSNYEEGGYQTCNGFIAINDGGLFGLGIGKSKQKYSYIPEPHTDSVFAIITEECGLLWDIVIFILWIIVIKQILNLASKANTIRGRYICLGVAIYIFMHIFINLGGLFGLIPLTGVPLPFLSYGGSFTLSLIVSLAVIQRIHIETDKKVKGVK